MTHCPHPSYRSLLLQIAAEGRGTPPCKPGFSEDKYKIVLPDIVEEGRPLFNGERPGVSACYVLRLNVYQTCTLASVFYISRTGMTYLNN